MYCKEVYSTNITIPKSHGDRPYVIASFAVSLDGKLASKCGDVRLSGFEDKVEIHKLRSIVDAILVGVNTILHDNPHLTVSEKYYKSDRHPIRIVLDSKCRTPPDSEVITRRTKVKTIIATTTQAPKERIKKLKKMRNVDVVIVGEKEVDISSLLKILKRNYGVNTLMVEGGGKVLGSFFRYKSVDYVRISVTPIIFGAGGVDMIRSASFCKVEESPKLELVKLELCGRNIVMHFTVNYE